MKHISPYQLQEMIGKRCSYQHECFALGFYWKETREGIITGLHVNKECYISVDIKTADGKEETLSLASVVIHYES